MHHTNQNFNIAFSAEIYNDALIMIDNICILISNIPLIHFGMPAPNRSAADMVNSNVQREHQFDITSLITFIAYNNHSNHNGEFYFLDAPGGTGKTFLISLILARFRSQNHIVLEMLRQLFRHDGGRTPHSALKLPLNIHIKPTTQCII